MLSESRITALRQEKQRHIDELTAINRRVNEIINRYKQAVDIELNAIENIDNIFSENGIPIVPEEDNEEEIAVEETEIVDEGSPIETDTIEEPENAEGGNE